MRHLRVVMVPKRSVGGGGAAIVSGFSLTFSRLGHAVGPVLFQASAAVELSCVLIDKIRADERGEPVPLATLRGQLSADPSGSELSLSEPVAQDPALSEVFEHEGHRRPRRRLLVEIGRAPPLELLLPDEMQVTSGFMEVTAKLSVNGEVHADETQNEVLDVPLLPLKLTHALFHFVDSAGEPLAQRTVVFQESAGETFEAVTDDFGEIYLDASRGQRFTVVNLLPAGEAPVAIVETQVSDSASAVA